MLCSALQQEGIAEVWETVLAFREALEAGGEFAEKRCRQATSWMWTLLMDDLKDLFLRDPQVEALLGPVQEAVAGGITTPAAAARRLLEVFKRSY